ncbi:hypothetical protein MNBD_GAMMA09-2004 [hydrothermal vent metagenome]|uniref:DUF4440 domain-containing protein n=1 Tax=hydrothermal vent metagenome TaxID=652676 RepID=A0A3B0Y492_9ZZZZ
MNNSSETQIEECEEILKNAMLKSDISELDKLLADNLIFINHLGQLMSKQDDLEAHKTGILKINKITLTDRTIKTYSNIAVVTVKAHIIGSFNGVKSDNYFRFTRIWNKSKNKKWHVISAHSSILS